MTPPPTLPGAGPVEHDGYLVMCLPDSDLDGLQRFHFAVKRTCAYDIEGRAEPSRWQQRLVPTDVHFEDGDPFSSSVRQATEMAPPFGGTDVAVVGHAYAPGGEATHFYPSVQVGSHTHRILAIGDRTVVVDRQGRAHISRARPFRVRPIRYEYAYGGVDHHNIAAPVPCPSNPIGTGFLLGPPENGEPLEAWAAMPNFEDPDNVYDRDSLVVPAVRDMPLRPPAGFGWIPATWTPRADKAGMPESTRPAWLLAHGDHDPDGAQFKAVEPAFWRAANPGLQLPLLKGDETVTLTHLDPTRESIRFRLPGLDPKLAIAINGEKARAVPLELSMVHIDADLRQIQMTWRGTLPRPEFLEGLHTLTFFLYDLECSELLTCALVGTGFPIELMKGELPPGTVDLSALDRLREVPR